MDFDKDAKVAGFWRNSNIMLLVAKVVQLKLQILLQISSVFIFRKCTQIQYLQVLSIVLGLFRVYRRWHPTHLNGDYFINHEIRIPIETTRIQMEANVLAISTGWCCFPWVSYRTTWHWMMPSSPKEVPDRSQKGGKSKVTWGYPPVISHSWQENPPFESMYFLLKIGIFQPAMFVYRRVFFFIWMSPGSS